MIKKDKKWANYEEVATYLLNEIAHKFNLNHFEKKQKIKGKKSGVDWEIDAKGVGGKAGEIFLLVECRRHTTAKQRQGDIAALAYIIKDTGAAGGIVVSPLGLQAGARKVANAENIHRVFLTQDCTKNDYLLKFLDEIRMGFLETETEKESLTITLKDKNGTIIKENTHE
ncbi:MAG: restriction endonuclease [Thermodesulfovibrionales bacterium]|nr:restriction endonuclease [Thermodesulfovibrionales bacterium]